MTTEPSKPTPGPWALGADVRGPVIGGSGRLIAGWPRGVDGNDKANIRLIVAACNAVQQANISLEALERRPTLLQETVVLLGALRNRVVESLDGFGSPMLDQIDALLAQLEGRA